MTGTDIHELAKGHTDAELNNPATVSTRRLGEIVAECLQRWDGYPTIPGSLRWRRNGSMALDEILRRRELGGQR